MGAAIKGYNKLHARLQSVDGMTPQEATRWLANHAPDDHAEFLEEYNAEWRAERARIEDEAARRRKELSARSQKHYCASSAKGS